MITPSHKVRIFVASDPVDFRKGHDGLAALVQGHLRQKPFDGSVYVFSGLMNEVVPGSRTVS